MTTKQKDPLIQLIEDGKWRDIESAPRDGRYIVFKWIAKDNPRTNCDILSMGCIEPDDYWDCEGWTASKLLDDHNIKPTHFRPLPDDRLANVCEVLLEGLEELSDSLYGRTKGIADKTLQRAREITEG